MSFSCLLSRAILDSTSPFEVVRCSSAWLGWSNPSYHPYELVSVVRRLLTFLIISNSPWRTPASSWTVVDSFESREDDSSSGYVIKSAWKVWTKWSYPIFYRIPLCFHILVFEFSSILQYPWVLTNSSRWATRAEERLLQRSGKAKERLQRETKRGEATN